MEINKYTIKDMEEKIKMYADLLDISIEDLKNKSRKPRIIDKRHIIWFALRKIDRYKINEIKIAFGYTSHSTIVNAISRVFSLLEANDKIVNVMLEKIIMSISKGIHVDI